MYINEVENIVGLSKKSIRYYEENGLLSPTRNKKDYRIYNEDDINKLKIIKFLRELNVPISDLKLLNDKKMTLQKCMQDRINKIEEMEIKFQRVKNMCEQIKNSDDTFDSININNYFKEIRILNKEGFTMHNVKSNKKKKIVGAVLSSVLFSVFFILLLGVITYFQITMDEKCPWMLFIILVLIFGLPVIGILYNLIARIKEIMGGEEDEASKY